MKLVFAEQARRDLIEIGDYIASRDPVRARDFVTRLRKEAKKIADMPLAFQVLDRFERQAIRRKVFGNYLIFYRVENEAVRVLHILHGARDYETLLSPDE